MKSLLLGAVSASLLTLGFSISADATSQILADDMFVIVTSPRLGFTDHEKTFLLGQPTVDVLRSLGLAERVARDRYTGPITELFAEEEYSKAYLANTNTYVYVNDGVLITSDSSGLIKGAVFYLTQDWPAKPANVKTQWGVGRGSSLQEIVRLYGQPGKVIEQDLLGDYDLSVYYKFGNDVLSFHFWDGALRTVEMVAE